MISRRGVSLRFFYGLSALAMGCILLTGCGRDQAPVTVDFSKKEPVQHPATATPDKHLLRVAVGAMVSPQQTFIYYRQLLDYLGERLGFNVELVQRKTYQEINELIGNQGIDLAFICSGPYVEGKERYGFRLVVAPEIHGTHFYRSYLIVARNSPYHDLSDLRGKVFAFTDPDSLTGKRVPSHWVSEMGSRPEDFFASIIYTYSHDNSIVAVARGVVDGAAVDSLVWDYLNAEKPQITSRTRVIKRSLPLAIPPLVAAGNLDDNTIQRVRDELVTMHRRQAGKRILDRLMIDRFVVPKQAWYDTIRSAFLADSDPMNGHVVAKSKE